VELSAARLRRAVELVTSLVDDAPDLAGPYR
jgi:hypothetical protein